MMFHQSILFVLAPFVHAALIDQRLRKQPHPTSIDTPLVIQPEHSGNSYFLQNLKEELPKSFGHDAVGIILLAVSILSVFCLIPILYAQRVRYNSQHHDQKTFKEYLRHRFVHWYQSRSYSSVMLLGILTMTLIDCGVFFYWIMVGVNPWQSLYKIFAWSSRTNIQDEMSLGGRTVAVFVSVGGMIIFGLLLGIVQDSFKSLFLAIETGRTTVVEGDHVIIVGHMESTNELLSELVEAHDATGGTVLAVLDERPRRDVLQLISHAGIKFRNSTLIVRSGRGDTHDLSMLAAETAKAIVLVADTNVGWEDADSKTIAAIMALKTQNWPLNGMVVAQCRVAANRTLMEQLYPGKIEVIVVSDIIGGLMVSSNFEPSMGQLVRMLLTFQGSDFHMQAWPELKDKLFGEIIFQFPDAVPIGVYNAKSGYTLCPSLSYTMQVDDELIVMAEDPTSYKPSAEIYHKECVTPIPEFCKQLDSAAAASRRGTKHILITGWNKMVGPLLANLEPVLHHGGTVDIYSARPAAYREEQIASIKKRRGKCLDHLVINHLEVPVEDFASIHELNSLALDKYEMIFSLSDVELVGCAKSADEITVALLVKMQSIVETRSKAAGNPVPFQPVIEICCKRTAERLAPYGLVNTFSVHDLVALALAQVTVNRRVHGIIADLLTVDGQGIDLKVCKLDELMPGKTIPREVSFADVVDASRAFGGDAVVVGWSVQQVPFLDTPREGKRSSRPGSSKASLYEPGWQINPPDKTTKRLWTSQDRIVMFLGGGSDVTYRSNM